MGKSFEIRPTGVAHADLKLPPAWGLNYPQGEGEDSDKVIEHYSWKKVTTSVSGFILGSPTIDHYGEMTVRRTRSTLSSVLKTFTDHQSPNKGYLFPHLQTQRLASEGLF